MDYHLYITDKETRDRLVSQWPAYAELVIDDLDHLTLRHTVILRPGVQVLDQKFFTDIQDLVSANNYLDALRHEAWLVFGNEYVKLHAGREYWDLNLRPVIGFDRKTWSIA